MHGWPMTSLKAMLHVRLTLCCTLVRIGTVPQALEGYTSEHTYVRIGPGASLRDAFLRLFLHFQ